MDDGERQRRVRVWDRTYTVTVYQKSKSAQLSRRHIFDGRMQSSGC